MISKCSIKELSTAWWFLRTVLWIVHTLHQTRESTDELLPKCKPEVADDICVACIHMWDYLSSEEDPFLFWLAQQFRPSKETEEDEESTSWGGYWLSSNQTSTKTLAVTPRPPPPDQPVHQPRTSPEYGIATAVPENQVFARSCEDEVGGIENESRLNTLGLGRWKTDANDRCFNQAQADADAYSRPVTTTGNTTVEIDSDSNSEGSWAVAKSINGEDNVWTLINPPNSNTGTSHTDHKPKWREVRQCVDCGQWTHGYCTECYSEVSEIHPLQLDESTDDTSAGRPRNRRTRKRYDDYHRRQGELGVNNFRPLCQTCAANNFKGMCHYCLGFPWCNAQSWGSIGLDSTDYNQQGLFRQLHIPPENGPIRWVTPRGNMSRTLPWMGYAPEPPLTTREWTWRAPGQLENSERPEQTALASEPMSPENAEI